MAKEGKTIESLIADLKEAVEEKEVRIGINKEDFRPYAEQILSELSVFVEESEKLLISS